MVKLNEFVEGGAIPQDMNLTWKECRFNLFDYGGKAPATTALRVNYVSDDGAEYEQQYSVSDPARFIPSEDGKTLIAVEDAQALTKSSNFFLLINALINSGMPENMLDEDVSVLDGLYTFNIGMPEPKRAGLKRTEEQEARERVISVPSQILKAPWDKGNKGKTAPKAGKAETESGDDGVTDAAIAFVSKNVSNGSSMTRQQLATALFKDKAIDKADRDGIARLIFQPEFQVALLANGYSLDGETISKA